MNGLNLIVHRSTDQIGGNCIEIACAAGSRILLDVGRPLDAPTGATNLPQSLDLEHPVEGILISHPHQDHYGLLDETPANWPIYSGKAAGRLIHLTAGIFGKAPMREFRHWESGRTTEIGPFRVLPTSPTIRPLTLTCC